MTKPLDDDYESNISEIKTLLELIKCQLRQQAEMVLHMKKKKEKIAREPPLEKL